MTDAPRTRAETENRHRTVAIACAALVLGMTGAAFAAVPLYDWFCRVTGYGGTTRVATAAPARVGERTVEVRFDANVSPGLPWRFRAETGAVTVRVGEVATVNYVIENTADHETVGIAAYNVTPDLAGYWFNKIVCFCFNEQKLAAHEKVVVPVTFYVDPDIEGDKNLKSVGSITLSYTFFSQKPSNPKPLAAASQAGGPDKL